MGIYYGSRHSSQFHDKRPRRSQQRCPKCGTQMRKRGTFDECPGCKTTIMHETTTRAQDPQPVDNLAAKLKRAILPHFESGEQDFQRTVVPPELANEHRWLSGLGCFGMLFLVLGWGGLISLKEITGISIWFRLCYGMFVVSAIVNTAAMLHNHRAIRQAGLAWAVVMIPISIAAWFLIPAAAVVYLNQPTGRFTTMIANQIMLYGHLGAAVYYAWLAWFSWREMNYR